MIRAQMITSGPNQVQTYSSAGVLMIVVGGSSMTIYEPSKANKSVEVYSMKIPYSAVDDDVVSGDII